MPNNRAAPDKLSLVPKDLTGSSSFGSWYYLIFDSIGPFNPFIMVSELRLVECFTPMFLWGSAKTN